MFTKIQNKKATASLILIAYLSLFAANIYHYHNVNFSLNKTGFLNSAKTTKIFSHTLENCIVQSTFNSVHTIVINSLKFDTSINEINYLSISKLSREKNSFLLDIQKLRAPPFKPSSI